MLGDFGRYFRERLLIPKVMVLWVLLSGGMWLAAPGGLSHPAWAAVFAGLFVATFRLLDDLADRRHDALAHPRRCLVVTRHACAFTMTLAVLLLVISLVLAAELGGARALGLLGLTAFLVAVSLGYGSDARGARRIVSFFVLLKYPAGILLVADEPLRLATIFTSALFYAMTLAEEILSNRAKAFLPVALAPLAMCIHGMPAPV